MRKFLTILYLLVVVTGTAWAQSRVALVRLNSGTATLDGKAVKTATMASQGQTLKLNSGSEARIQLLGTSSEVTLKGPLTLKIDKAALAGEAKKVTRGGVAVALDIGNKNSAGAMVTRAQSSSGEKTTSKALRPTLPPKKKEDIFLLSFDSPTELKLPKGMEIAVYIESNDPNDDTAMEVAFTNTLPNLELPGDSLKPGVGYTFELSAYDGDSLVKRYNQTFRILSSEEKEILAAATTELMTLHDTQKSVLPLLRLASLHQDMDQNQAVLRYLKMAQASPYLQANDADLKSRLNELVTNFESSLEMVVPVKAD